VRQISVDWLCKGRSNFAHESIERHRGIRYIADTADNLAPCTSAATDTTHEFHSRRENAAPVRRNK
jgi:hypothetical protein